MSHEFETSRMTLDNACQGAAAEQFARVLAQAMANIADANTEATAERKITLEFSLKPDDSRENMAVTLKTTTKLAGPKPHSSIAFVTHHGGETVAINYNPKQLRLPSGPRPIEQPHEGGA